MKSFWKWNALFSFAALVCASQAAQSQIYPASPVKIISDSSPGSAPDVISRIVGELLGRSWGQQVIVINQPGASGSRAARVAASRLKSSTDAKSTRSAPRGSTHDRPIRVATVTH